MFKMGEDKADVVVRNASVEAIIDGLEPKTSNDPDMPRFTWWDHRGTAEWVEWGFPKP